jgi:hypothetical protein
LATLARVADEDLQPAAARVRLLLLDASQRFGVRNDWDRSWLSVGATALPVIEGR